MFAKALATWLSAAVSCGWSVSNFSTKSCTCSEGESTSSAAVVVGVVQQSIDVVGELFQQLPGGVVDLFLIAQFAVQFRESFLEFVLLHDIDCLQGPEKGSKSRQPIIFTFPGPWLVPRFS